MEEAQFNEIRMQIATRHPGVTPGKMMSSEAITYQGKVFAFFSKQKKMVFKLGKEYNPASGPCPMQVFNPFTKRAPLYGWFEVDYTHQSNWEPLDQQALQTLTTEIA